MASRVHCRRCGAALDAGSLKYLVTIHVTADFDGVLPAAGRMEELEAFMNQLDARDPVTLEKDSYQAQGYLLCPVCKESFLRDPLGLACDDEGGGRVH